MADKLHIIICSTRPMRIGPKIADWFLGVAKAHGGFDPVLVDLADFNLPVFDEPKHPSLGQYEHEHTKAWSVSVKAADAFVFVTPEYNYFAPPSFVNAIDFLSKEWNYKPAGLISYGGLSGGLRAAQSEKLLMTSVKLMPIPESVALPFAMRSIGDDGVFAPGELAVTSANAMLGELVRWSGALKTLR